MRLRRCELLAAVAVVLTVGFSCFGQNSPGPATLENLLQPDAAQDRTATPAPDANEPKSTRPAGAVTRPKDGVKHPDLDKAWAAYDATLAKAAERINAAISKQFSAATAKGDLDAAVKWQAALEKFEKAGEVPAEPETKAAVSAALADYKKAKQELAKAYKAVEEALTIQEKIPEARAARDEANAVSQDNRIGQATAVVFLSDLLEQGVGVGYGAFGKNGSLGYEGRLIIIKGVLSRKGISMHPPSNGASRVTYELPSACNHFKATAGINDSGTGQKTAVVFKVFGDKRLLWTSKPLLGAGKTEECDVLLTKGTKTVTLVVECPGTFHRAHAVWVDPCFSYKIDR
jgi:hypothetical protein